MKQETKADAAKMVMIPTTRLRECKINPRRHYDEASLRELGASMQEVGVIENLVVRPIAEGNCEVVAGSRRLRAAKLVGLAALPCVIRPLDDQGVLKIALIENLQRDDITPLEEAEAYRMLIDRGGYTKPGQNGKKKVPDVDRIAREVGKSPRYVYDSLELLERLSRLPREALLRGHILRSHAIELARLPEKAQNEALVWLTKRECWPEHSRYIPDEEPECLGTVKDLQKWIRDEVYHSLSDAPWPLDDAKLYPKAAGPACTTCQCRSDFVLFQPFPKVTKSTNCSKPECYEAKRKAWVAKRKKEFDDSKAEYIKVASGPVETTPGTPAVLHNWQYDEVKPNAKGAQKALDMATGRETYVKPKGQAKSKLAARPKDKPRPLKERRAELDGRRKAHAVTQVAERLGSTSLTSLKALGQKADKHPELWRLRIIALASSFGTDRRRDHNWGDNDHKKADYEPVRAEKVETYLGALWNEIRPVMGRRLSFQCNPDAPAKEAAAVAALIGLNWPEVLAEAAEAIPEPKAWAKLNPDGTPKAAGQARKPAKKRAPKLAKAGK